MLLDRAYHTDNILSDISINGDKFSIVITSKRCLEYYKNSCLYGDLNPSHSGNGSVDATGRTVLPPPCTGNQKVHCRVFQYSSSTSVDGSIPLAGKGNSQTIAFQITNELDTAGVVKVKIIILLNITLIIDSLIFLIIKTHI